MIPRHGKTFFNKKNTTLITIIVISAFILLVAPVRSVFTGGVYGLAVGIWGAGDAGARSWSSLVTNFRDKNTLVKENESLKIEMDRMQALVLDRNLLAEKVTKLEEALGRVKSDDRITANVLMGPGRSLYDTLVIDAGEGEGVAIGNMVVYAGSGFIGEVVEVSPSSSKVKLYSSPGEEHLVVVGAQHLPVNALGKGMGNFEAKVPQDSVVAVGDNVVTLKGNLILGMVSLVEEKPAEPFKRIFFRLPFNITEVRSVEIVR